MALFCVISANSGSFRAHCVKVHVRYLIFWWVLVFKFQKVYPDSIPLRRRQPLPPNLISPILGVCVTLSTTTVRHSQWRDSQKHFCKKRRRRNNQGWLLVCPTAHPLQGKYWRQKCPFVSAFVAKLCKNKTVMTHFSYSALSPYFHGAHYSNTKFSKPTVSLFCINEVLHLF